MLGTRDDLGQNNLPDAAAEIGASLPAYQRSLGLGLNSRNLLGALEREVTRAAEIYLRADPAHVITGLNWIDVDNDADRVRSMNVKLYLDHVATQARLKGTPAFDGSGVNGNTAGRTETDLFGPADQRYLNYTAFSWDHNNVAGDGSGRDDTGLTWAQYIRRPSTIVDEQIRLIDPMSFIGTRADTAPHWYVRAGTRDRDTSFVVWLNLDRALDRDRQVRDVDFHLAWNQPHGGNYDVPEAMAWIAGITRQ